ncbi:uncharacterized protein LOC106070421 isoform X1 [Biomphalaria glabrata]|uniref:Uncharacterized protein LOC106070421 isoform X1 n=1 Tax=Biomphalaria glabrata TaxID=6526 RepID=A0A9W2YN65_BIOGL|nr:uncharacterized protein LOC106070421 isoform X1 [Biomphalaria glabrata]XP_055864105.1 uncharacterized protein LOC106070421 isoform X1 [Biomphalaria glabrata]XP_055864106.1 uncharacterized protein LOC106070421 isoform X1 [Biomphalaria glabrata]
MKVVVFITSAAVIIGLITCQKTADPTMSNCDYLVNAGTNAAGVQEVSVGSPFKIFTTARVPEVTPGHPIQVTIGPFSQHLNFFNFTDFILYATPSNTANLEIEFIGTPNPHVGVFQMFDQWRAGAGGLSCNPRSRTEDSVGAFEERLLGIYRRYYPNNPMLQRYQPPARNQVSVLWWPTKEALMYPEVKFIANLKSMNNWFRIESTSWKVNRPVDQWANTERMLTQYQNLQHNMRAMERRLEQPL